MFISGSTREPRIAFLVNRVSCVLIVFAFTEKTPVRYQELENLRTQDTNLVKR